VGGFDTHGGGPAFIFSDKPLDNGWQATLHYEGIDTDFTVYVQCGKLVDSAQ
jgi:hypothetical protein